MPDAIIVIKVKMTNKKAGSGNLFPILSTQFKSGKDFLFFTRNSS